MKKKMIALLAGALLTLGASNAMAYFDDYELIRVVYNSSTGAEVATDLGNVTSLIASANGSTHSITVGGGSADAFTTVGGSDFAVAQDANLHVGYIALDYLGQATSNIWVSATKGQTVNNVGAGFTAAQNAAGSAFFSTYGQMGTSSGTVNFKTNPNAYYNNFNPSGAVGTFAQFLAQGIGEASLATLATASVQQGLYFWADGNVTGAGQAVGTGLTILTNADGSTTLTTATPIPAAAYLLGSGLMGLFGLRRKQRG